MAIELEKIQFKDNQEPAIDAQNLNKLQNNIEEAINEGAGSGDGILTGSVIGYNGEEVPEGYEEVSGASFGGGMPIGSGCDYFGSVAPTGFMFADGSSISRTEYSELFNIIGTIYGEGDGSTTFNLPDKRERVSVMRKEGSTNGTDSASLDILGAKGGEFKHKMTTAEMVAHKHRGGIATDTGAFCKFGTIWDDVKTTRYLNEGTGGTSSNYAAAAAYTSTDGSSTPFNIMQPYLVCNYIIKVK